MHLIAAHVEVELPTGLDTVTRVSSARELREATLAAAQGADLVIMAAAVADFRPAEYADFKIKKTDNPGQDPVIQLVRNPDILRELVERRSANREAGPQLIVGFAAETGDESSSPLDYGRAKLARKGCDYLAVNTVSATQGFGAEDNTLIILSANGAEPLVTQGTKYEVSEDLLRHVAQHLNN